MGDDGDDGDDDSVEVIIKLFFASIAEAGSSRKGIEGKGWRRKLVLATEGRGSPAQNPERD